MRSFLFAWLMALFCVPAVAWAGMPLRLRDPDERLLKQAGWGIDNADLLELLKQRSATPPAAVAALVRQLGSDSYVEREEASRAVVTCGAAALPHLRSAVHDGDLELRMRAEECLRRINRPGQLAAPAAAVRLLARRRPPEAAAALLRYLPHTGDRETAEQVWAALVTVAIRDGRPDPLLLPALKDEEPSRRAVAACLLGRYGDADARAAVRRLLEDADAEVRLRAAQGLLAGRDRSALTALIGLLDANSVAVAWQAEELLHWAAAGTGPPEVVGSGDAPSRKKCRAAWQQWCEQKGKQRDAADFGRGVRRPGLMLFAETPAASRVCLRGCDGSLRWHLEKFNDNPEDLRLLDGDRILLATGAGAAEYDLMSKVVWKAAFPGATLYRRLSNGNTFVSGKGLRAAEFRPDGSQFYNLAGSPDSQALLWMHSRDALIWPTASGRIAVLSQPGSGDFLQLSEVDVPAATLLRPAEVLYGWDSPWRLLDTLSDGGFLVQFGPTVCLVDARFRSLWEYPLLARSASQWWDGRTIVLGPWEGGDLLQEIDREGRCVREELFAKDEGPRLVRCCLGLLRVGFTPENEVDLDDPAQRGEELKSTDARRRLRAVIVLRDQGTRAAGGLSCLLDACDDPNAEVRAAIWKLLSEWAPRGRLALAQSLKSPRPAARAAAAGLLVFAGTSRELAPYVPDLLRVMKDDDARVRVAAAGTLSRVAPDEEGILPVLTRALEDRTLPSEGRALAARSVARLGFHGLPALPLLKRTADELRDIRAAKDDWQVAADAYQVLKLIGEIKNGNLAQKREAIRQLELLEPGALRAIGQPAGRVVVPALVEVLAVPPYDFRPVAQAAISNLGSAAADGVPGVIAILQAPASKDAEADTCRRDAAVFVLWCIGPPARAARPILERLARDDPDAHVRNMARYALREIENGR